jgi:uncharacterized protein YdhG (YjbR/CyaY superfamily)
MSYKTTDIPRFSKTGILACIFMDQYGSMENIKAKNIDEYISFFPAETQLLLEEVRATIRKAAPKAEEAIKYAMPTFVLNGKNIAHFAAYKGHIGFYPAPTAIKEFEKDLVKYKQGKGSIQFPIDEAMPLKLITKMVKWNIGYFAELAELKKRK